MAKKKEGRKLTIAFDPDVTEIVEDLQQQKDLLSFKDAAQAIVRDWNKKTQKSIIQSINIENKTEPIESSFETLSEKQGKIIPLSEFKTELEAYTQYKEDMNTDPQIPEGIRPQKQAIIPKDAEDKNVKERLQEMPFCPYRTVIEEKNRFWVYCADVDKIPAEVCITRCSRYTFMNRKCMPISRERLEAHIVKKAFRPRNPDDDYKYSKGGNVDWGDSEGVEPDFSQNG